MTAKKITFRYREQLIWPDSVSRTKQRSVSRSKATWLQGCLELQQIASKIGIIEGTITANVKRSNSLAFIERTDRQVGVSILYTDRLHCKRIVYCDRYLSDTANLREIVKSLEAYHKVKTLQVGYIKFNQKIS